MLSPSSEISPDAKEEFQSNINNNSATSRNLSSSCPSSTNTSFSNQSRALPPDHGMEMRTRRKIVAGLVSASMSTGRLLSKIGLSAGEHATVRKLSRFGVGMGRSEIFPGITWRKASLAGVKVRVYLPENTLSNDNNKKEQPVCIYFHGGGWVVSSARCYHKFTAFLARDTQTVVISVDYRLAPENPFPAGLDDCLAVTLAVLNGDFDPNLFFPHSLDLSRVVLAGDSAGGNLACCVALDLIRAQDFRLHALLLICPALQAVTMNFPSYKEHGAYQPIGLDWFVPRYAGLKGVPRRLRQALWRGTHLAPGDRAILTQTVTQGFAAFYSSSLPSMVVVPSSISSGSGFASNTSSGGGDDDVEYGEAQIIEPPETDRMSSKKTFYLEGEDEDLQITTNSGGRGSGANESTSGGSCAVSPSIGDALDEELSPFVARAVTELAKNKRAWPLLADDEDLQHLPRTFLQICECDPLRNENEVFGLRVARVTGGRIAVSLLEKAGHIESLQTERLPSKVALKGYKELIDFIVSLKGNHANRQSGAAAAIPHFRPN